MATDPAAQARNCVIQIVTAAKAGDFGLASKIANEFSIMNGGLLPLVIAAVAFIETVINSVAEDLDMDANILFQGIALGVSVKEMENRKNQENNDEQG